MTEKQKNVIKEWEKTEVTHPSYDKIAAKLGTNKSYVFRVIKKYLADKKSLLKGK